MILIKIKYNSHINDCKETVIHRNLKPSEALIKLRNANFPAYICDPKLADTDGYFLMEVKNRKCLKEYAKIID